MAPRLRSVKMKEVQDEHFASNFPSSTASQENMHPPIINDIRSTTASPNPPPFDSSADTVPDPTVYTTNNTEQDAMSSLALHSREVIKVVQKIETLGINTTLPSLPKFVVIGDQSAGKSSIIEAACEIALPRSHGTCTRCPFHITTSAPKDASTDSWSCKVSLHKRYTYGLSPRKGRKSLFQRWDEQDLEVIDFMKTSSKDALKDILRRAQLAVLHPQVAAAGFVADDVDYEDSGVGFSPNVITVEIEGSGLPELSFYDLPGAINTVANKDDQDLVTVVEQLIKHYLKDQKALILLACGADQDLETSTAFRFLRQEDATARCMGVLTKPDLVVPSTAKASTIYGILNGEKFELGGSWFMTRQMSQEQLEQNEAVSASVSYAEARRQEAAFFKNWLRAGWCSQLGKFHDRCGITQLQAAISQELTAHIISELPEIQHRVQERLDTIDGNLAGFPLPPLHPSITVHTLINEIHGNIKTSIVGDAEENKFRQKYRAIFVQVRTTMKDAKPQVDVMTPGHQKPIHSIPDDEEEDQEIHTPTPVRTPALKRRKRMNGTPAPASTPAPPAFTPSPTKPSTNAKFTLQEIRARYERGTMSGLQGQLNPKVTEALALQSLKAIPHLIKSSLALIKKLGSAMIQQAVDRALDSRHSTRMYPEASDCIQSFWNDLNSEQELVIQHLLDCEMKRAITYQTGPRATEPDELHAQRLLQRVYEHYDEQEKEGFKVPPPEGQATKVHDPKFVKDLGDDKFALELQAMRIVLSYYDIACRRILDTMAVLLDHGLLYVLQTKVFEKLLEGLRANDNDCCAALLADDPERERERLRLLSEKEKLKQALQELQSLQDIANS